MHCTGRTAMCRSCPRRSSSGRSAATCVAGLPVEAQAPLSESLARAWREPRARRRASTRNRCRIPAGAHCAHRPEAARRPPLSHGYSITRTSRSPAQTLRSNQPSGAPVTQRLCPTVDSAEKSRRVLEDFLGDLSTCRAGTRVVVTVRSVPEANPQTVGNANSRPSGRDTSLRGRI